LVTPAEIEAGTEIAVLSSSAAGHAHFVRLTAADFVALKAGLEVRKKSCADIDHEWVLTCQSVASTPGTPACTQDCGADTSVETACE
jgi:hypothetical protein